MKIYHYTTVESLLKILKSKKLRFSSLAYVDDSYEQIACKDEAYSKIGRFCYVSSWTMKSEDDFQWNLYGDKMQGVMIELDCDFLKLEDQNFTFLKLFNLEKQEYDNGDVVDIPKPLNKLTSQMLMTGKSFTFDKVEYNDRNIHPVEIIIKDAEIYNGLINMEINHMNEIGKYKRKIWKHQEEVRFKMMTVPWTLSDFNRISRLNNELKKSMTDTVPYVHILHTELIKKVENEYGFNQLPYIDIELSDEFFENISIVLGPKLSKNQLNKEIVKDCVKAVSGDDFDIDIRESRIKLF